MAVPIAPCGMLTPAEQLEASRRRPHVRPRSCESPAGASGWGHACSGSLATCRSGPRAGLGPEKGQHPAVPRENPAQRESAVGAVVHRAPAPYIRHLYLASSY